MNIPKYYHVALRVNAIIYEIQDFTLIDLLLKLANPASTFLNIQIEKLIKIILSIVFNFNHHHFVSSLSYAKHKYFYIFHRYSNSFYLADFLLLVCLIMDTNMQLIRTKISDDIAR